MGTRQSPSRISHSFSSRSFLIWACIGVLLLWIFSAFVIYLYGDSWSERGTIGDMFGAVNALFSGLAFAALLFTIIMQREEMMLNREEIILNRRSITASSLAQKESQDILIKQVEQMHLSAKMNAIQTLITYYNSEIEHPLNSEEVIAKAKAKSKELITMIDRLIEEIEDSNIE